VEGCEKGEVIGGLGVKSENPLNHWSSLRYYQPLRYSIVLTFEASPLSL
jgi:hypothetical protein